MFVVVPGVALGTKTVPLRIADVTFRDTSPVYAWELVAQYAQGTFEQRFGYPTGYFSIQDMDATRPDRLLMREMQPAGAITDGCSRRASAFSRSGFGSGGGCFGGCFLFVAGTAVGLPFYCVSAADRFCRVLLRSRVDVRFSASGADTVASFAFYGPSAWALRGRYKKVFARPALPPELTTHADGGAS
ncbi:MAG: hypothetical protein J2P26_04445 [Nocardiopsaceae bacterium]|nr:hypothetical protein [Nocardiopsaceae bacterium]